MTRKRIPEKILTEVLTKSRRRCAFCFGLNFDKTYKKGQIAHINKKNDDHRFENLAHLCLDHHDQYDSSTSQSKGLTEQELIHHLKSLYKEMEYSNDAYFDENRSCETQAECLKYFFSRVCNESYLKISLSNLNAGVCLDVLDLSYHLENARMDFESRKMPISLMDFYKPFQESVWELTDFFYEGEDRDLFQQGLGNKVNYLCATKKFNDDHLAELESIVQQVIEDFEEFYKMAKRYYISYDF